MAVDRTSGPAFKTWDETGVYARRKKTKPKTIGRAIGKPQKRKKLKPAPPLPPQIVAIVHEFDMETRAGVEAWLEARKRARDNHFKRLADAFNTTRTDKHGKSRQARVPAKGTSRAKKKHTK